jgi:hypothetical protein
MKEWLDVTGIPAIWFQADHLRVDGQGIFTVFVDNSTISFFNSRSSGYKVGSKFSGGDKRHLIWNC